MAYDTEARMNWQRYCYGRDRGHLEYMERAARCEEMYMGGGEQWTREDRMVLQAQRRPAYEFNEILPSCNSAIGYQIQNRMDIAYRPRGGQADMNTATVLSKVVKQVCDQVGLHWQETQVCSDGIIQQRGYFDVRMDFNDNIKGEITVDTLDPMDVVPDPDAKSYDPDKWGDVLITRWLTIGEIEGVYGKEAAAAAKASGDEGVDFGNTDGETERNKFGNVDSMGSYDAYGNEADGLQRYRLIDRQRWVYEMTPCIVLPDTGDVRPIDQLSPDQVAAATARGAIRANRMRKRIKWVVSTYCKVLFDKYSPYEHFTPVPYFAYFRRGKTRGMVDNAIGPQEALNKAVSQFVHIINTSANSGWKVQQNSLTNMTTKDLEVKGAVTGLVLEYKEGANEPEKIQPNSIPSGVDHLIDRATQALKDVTVPDSMRGLQGNAVSGVAKQADQFASQQQLAVPLDNLGRTRHMLARRFLKLIQRYYDSPRVFMITETDPITGKEIQTPLTINQFDPTTGGYLNDVTVGTYDVVVTEQPMQVTFENSQFEQAMAMRERGVALPDSTVIKHSNLTDKEDILQSMQAAQQPTDPTLEAKANLLNAQAKKTLADATGKTVETMYSATQAGQLVAINPAVAPIADQILASAGFEDANGAPAIPAPTHPIAVAPGSIPHNTDPTTPANPDVGVNAGIETPAADALPA